MNPPQLPIDAIRCRGRFLLLAAILVSAGLSACGSGKGPEAYVPPADAARKSVETALRAWQSGAPYGPLNDTKPAINVFDSRWQSRKTLERFEVGDEVKGNEHRQFQVRVKLADQPESTETYRVIGIDPINVFREEDYRRAVGM